MSPSLVRLTGVFLIGACGLGGYAAGGGFDGVAEPQAQVEQETRTREHTGSPARRVELDDFARFEELLDGGKDTDIWKAVSRLPKETLPDAFRRLREKRAITASDSPDAQWLDDIESALYFHWAELDPQAALADVVAFPETTDESERTRKGQLMKSVLTAWMRTDPNAAYRSVKDDEKLEYYGRDLLVRLWKPENVFENLKLYPENHQLLLGWYCGAAAEDPVKRNAMLVALKEQKDMQHRDWAYLLLFRSWGYSDFGSAMAEAEAQQLPGTVKQLIQDNLRSNPWQVLPWSSTKDIPPGGPRWEEGYSQWLDMDGPSAREWFNKQAPLWESKGHSAAVAGFLAQDLDDSQQNKSSDGEEAAAKNLTELMNRWKGKDPATAAKWLETAPPAARKLLSGEGGAK
ncbi:MAG: hypothetical protein EOP88_11635 [Verrucomicrobiaceae bacterium]|nr:MAG: hypothetical protein EOP88_11635 [Verrucomicrobiaceae bacterium]